MDKGLIEPMQLLEHLSDYSPIEYALHAFVCIASLCLEEYSTFLLCLPLVVINGHSFVKKTYRLHFLTREEYKPSQAKKEKEIKYKIAYYGVLMVLVVFQFMFAASNAFLYNIFGTTYSLPTFVSSSALAF